MVRLALIALLPAKWVLDLNADLLHGQEQHRQQEAGWNHARARRRNLSKSTQRYSGA